MQYSTHALPHPPLRSQRLLDQVRKRIRWLHFSLRAVQALQGHACVSITMIHAHVLKVVGAVIRSPLDALTAR